VLALRIERYIRKVTMSSAAITHSDENDGVLPLDEDRVAEHLREYIDDLQDEIRWSESTNTTKLVAAQDVQNKKLLKGKASTGLRPAMKSAVLPSFGLSIDG